jgi:sulfate adenylyltransferase
VKRTYEYKDKFLGGKITLVNEPKFNEPYATYWKTPKQHMDAFREKGWEAVVAHQTRNVPHTGHEWLMKGAWFAANEDLMVDKLRTGVLVNCIIGEKRKGDYIDEAILLAHDMLRKAGYFRDDVHMVTFTLWDMRYAGPREAIFHAALRANLGCTHHMYGRDHAGVGDYYGTYDAHYLLKQVKDKLKIKPVFVLEWWYCPVCAEVTCSALCGHSKEKQKFSGTLIRSIIMDGVKPTRLIFRPEVFDTVMECADKYGFGSPFVTDKYLADRNPIFNLEHMDVGKA